MNKQHKKQVEDLIAAGEKATAGLFCAKEGFVFADKRTAATADDEVAHFITQAANSRQSVAAMYNRVEELEGAIRDYTTRRVSGMATGSSFDRMVKILNPTEGEE